MKNIKYAFHGLSSRVGISIIILLQVIVSLYFFNSATVQFIQLKEEQQQLLKIYDGKKPLRAYTRRGEAEKKINTDKEKKFREYLFNNDNFESVVVFNDGIYVKEFNGGEKFLDFFSEIEAQYIPKGYKKVKTLQVSNKFYKIFDLPISDGRFFDEGDFKDINCIPVVLGYDYRNIYKLGETFNISDLNREGTLTCKVIGFLKKNTRCIDNVQYSKVLNMNNHIIYPLMENFTDNTYDSSYFLDQGAIFAKDVSKNDEIFTEIHEKCKENDLWNLTKYTVEEQMNYTKEMDKEGIKNDISIFFMIMIFCSIGIITSMLSSIRKRRGEFGVHLLCGAKMKDIIIRIVLEIGIIIGGAFIAIVPISLIKYKNINSIVYLFLFSIILITVLSIIPIMKIRKLNISEIVKGDGHVC